MPDLPPEIYLPAFGAMTAAITWLAAMGTKLVAELWRRNQVITDRDFARGDKMVTSLDESTVAQRELRDVIEEQSRVVNQLLAAHQGGIAGVPERRDRNPR